MYKSASDGRQRVLHQGRPTDWINGEEKLSADDLLRQLQQQAKMLEDRIKAAPIGSEDRKRMGREKNEVQNQLKALRYARPKAPPDWKKHFVNEAKRILSASQFEMVMNAAKIESAREQARNYVSKGERA